MAGSAMIGYQPISHRGLPNFFRMVVTCHPEQTLDHMDTLIQIIDQTGRDL